MGDGFVAAVGIAILVSAVPVLWVVWWLVSDIGETATGSGVSMRRHRAA